MVADPALRAFDNSLRDNIADLILSLGKPQFKAYLLKHARHKIDVPRIERKMAEQRIDRHGHLSSQGTLNTSPAFENVNAWNLFPVIGGKANGGTSNDGVPEGATSRSPFGQAPILFDKARVDQRILV